MDTVEFLTMREYQGKACGMVFPRFRQKNWGGISGGNEVLPSRERFKPVGTDTMCKAWHDAS